MLQADWLVAMIRHTHWQSSQALPSIDTSSSHGLRCGIYECQIVPPLDTEHAREKVHHSYKRVLAGRPCDCYQPM